MNKIEFIEKLTNLYEDFTEKNTQARIEAYNEVLIGEIDYSRLYKKLIQTYKSFSFAPSPAVIFEIVETFRREKEREEYEKELEEIKKQKEIKQQQEEIERQKAKKELTQEEIEEIRKIQDKIRGFKLKGVENE